LLLYAGNGCTFDVPYRHQWDRAVGSHTVTVSRNEDLLEKVRGVRSKLPELASRQILPANLDFETISLPEHDSDVLRDLILAESVQSVVEIGLAFGSSALAIGEALVSRGSQGASHQIIDAHQDDFKNVGWDAIVLAELDTICRLVDERSQIALPRLVTEGFIADAAFVDGSHVFHNVFVDLYFLRDLVRPGGLIILDDCQWPSVGTAVNYYVVNAGWIGEPIREPTRLRAFRLPDPACNPTFESFRSFQT
jgi:predicted O-methyltransferase YrrM